MNQIEGKFKSMSFLKLTLLSFVLSGGCSLVYVIVRDILNMLN